MCSIWYRGRVAQGENSGKVTIKIKQLTGWGALPRKVSRVRVNVIFKNVSFDISGRLCSKIVAYTMVSAGVAVLRKLCLPPSYAGTLSQKSRYKLVEPLQNTTFVLETFGEPDNCS